MGSMAVEHRAIDKKAMVAPGTAVRRDLIGATLLAVVLSLCWTIRDWSHLSWLILPDTDDMMRLAQVRDWLAGQGVNDWTQYRMAPPAGSPMHWSRVSDVGIAALILAALPFVGRHGAELFAVIAYPAILFAASLFLSARIARRLWGAEAGPVAIVLAAIALPGTIIFLPGRVDHHSLQVVLVELAILMAMARARFVTGTVAGTAIALNLIIGLETVPHDAAILLALFACWAARGTAERMRLAGVACGLGGTTLVFLLFLRPDLWSAAMCDAFTPASAFAALAGSGALAALAAATPVLADTRTRWVVGTALGAVVLAALLLLFPACLAGPYGQIDPFLQRELMAYIDEANGVLAQGSVARMVQLTGLLVIACLVAGWTVWRQPAHWRRWAPLIGVVVVSAIVTVFQVRGAYIGTPVSAALLAGLVCAARRRTSGSTPALLGAWLVSAGLAWATIPPIVHKAVLSRTDPQRAAPLSAERFVCKDGAVWAAMDRYPSGVVMASTNLAAYVVGATRMATIGAGYHRNNTGNMAMYGYFLSTPGRAATIARTWKVDYVAFCPGDFSEMAVTQRFGGSVAALLTQGRTPPGLERLDLPGSSLRLYRTTD